MSRFVNLKSCFLKKGVLTSFELSWTLQGLDTKLFADICDANELTFTRNV